MTLNYSTFCVEDLFRHNSWNLLLTLLSKEDIGLKLLLGHLRGRSLMMGKYSAICIGRYFKMKI